MENRYYQYKVCKSCGAKMERNLEKLTAAFVSRRSWVTPCNQCGCEETLVTGDTLPDIDEDVLQAWCLDESLSILEQDEDLMLAEAKNLGLLLHFLDSADTPDSRKNILLSALCVLIYDNSASDDDSEDKAIDASVAAEVIQALKSRQSVFMEVDLDFIPEYLREVVFPKLGFSSLSM